MAAGSPIGLLLVLTYSSGGSTNFGTVPGAGITLRNDNRVTLEVLIGPQRQFSAPTTGAYAGGYAGGYGSSAEQGIGLTDDNRVTLSDDLRLTFWTVTRASEKQ